MKTRTSLFFSVLTAAALLACGSNPKPEELLRFEEKRVGEYAPAITENYKPLADEYETYYKQAIAAHEDEDKSMTLYYTDLADITFRTAVSLLNQKDFKTQQVAAEERLAAANQLLEKAGQRQKTANMGAELKFMTAEKKIMEAKSVGADKHAADLYNQAVAMMEKANSLKNAGDTATAMGVADQAAALADQATTAAKPAYEKAEKVRKTDETFKQIMADASKIPSATSRIASDGNCIIAITDLFDKGKTSVRGDKQVSIMEMARIINAYPDYAIVIAGHTDNRGNAKKNVELSENRAQTVARDRKSVV